MNYRIYLRRGLLGIMISTLFTMLSAVISWGTLVLSPTEIIGTLVLGLIIGEISIIFECDFWNFGLRLLLHMGLTFIIVIGYNSYFANLSFSGSHLVTFVIQYIIIYISVWIVVVLTTKNDIDLINERLRHQRNQKTK